MRLRLRSLIAVPLLVLVGARVASAQTAPAAPHVPPAPPATMASPPPADGFSFGSYGRIGVGTDLRGATPEPVAVVAHGARVVQASYLELDLRYLLHATPSTTVRTVTTLAFFGDPFHYTGQTAATSLGLRNLYAEASLAHGLSAWVGARMYRGDDIYLLDWWPLDNANTVGAGVALHQDRLDVAVHAGANRLLDPFQVQTDVVPAPGFGTETVVTLDRQRLRATATGGYRFFGPPEGPALKAKLYLDLQGLPAGTRERADMTEEALPSDSGWGIGGQLGAWGFGDADAHMHANLFLRLSQGLAAYEFLAAPFGFDASKKTSGASELLVGWSANYELPFAGLLVGGYARRFVTASPDDNDPLSGAEYIVDARPYAKLSGPLQAAVDVSYQARFPRGASPTALTTLDPAVFQLAPMLLLTPRGAGSFSRPQLRLVYRAAWLNAGARDQYALDDPRRAHSLVHYLGVQAEWWFNSSYL